MIFSIAFSIAFYIYNAIYMYATIKLRLLLNVPLYLLILRTRVIVTSMLRRYSSCRNRVEYDVYAPDARFKKSDKGAAIYSLVVVRSVSVTLCKGVSSPSRGVYIASDEHGVLLLYSLLCLLLC